MIPVLMNHDYGQLPVGIVKAENGEIKIKMHPDTEISLDEFTLAPGFIITKQTGNVIEEVELLEISLVRKQ